MKNLKWWVVKLNELALFAGAGGGILGGHLLGWRTVAAVEIEDYPRRVLLQRQADGILPRFPIWDDVRTFDGKPWRGKIDIVTGGFPCQDISVGNQSGEGLDGARSGLWKEMSRIISEIQPPIVFVENSPLLVGRGLVTVVGDINAMGYDVRWCVLGSGSTAGNCKGERIWILATADKIGCGGIRKKNRDKIHNKVHSNESDVWSRIWCEAKRCVSFDDWKSVLHSFPFRDGSEVAHWVDRVGAVGNGQDPFLAATVYEILKQHSRRAGCGTEEHEDEV